MSEWSEELVNRVAVTLRARRLELGLSAQQVADRTADLGHPLNRSTLADLENGRVRDRLKVGDLLALAEALRLHPGFLLYPGEGSVEVLPEVLSSSGEAREWLAGHFIPATATDNDSTDGRLVEYRYRGDERQGRELLAIRDLLLTHSAELEQLEEAGEGSSMRAVALRSVVESLGAHFQPDGGNNG